MPHSLKSMRSKLTANRATGVPPQRRVSTTAGPIAPVSWIKKSGGLYHKAERQCQGMACDKTTKKFFSRRRVQPAVAILRNTTSADQTWIVAHEMACDDWSSWIYFHIMGARPSTNGANGRGANGQFTKGNKGGPGNPYAQQVARLRTVIINAVTDDDLELIVARLVEDAKGGDLAAIRELFSRLLGKPHTTTDPAVIDFDKKRVKLAEGRLKLDKDRLVQEEYKFMLR